MKAHIMLMLFFLIDQLGWNVIETAPVSRSTSAGRPTLRVHTAPMMPQTKTTMRTPSSIPNIDPAEKQRDKR